MAFRLATVLALVFVVPASGHELPEGIASVVPDRGIERAVPGFEGISSGFLRGGGFEAEGLFATHATMADGAVFPPHTHPDARFTLVVEGTMFIGVGETFDPARLVAYPEGSMFWTEAGVPHFMQARDGDVSVLDVGAGPTTTEFVSD